VLSKRNDNQSKECLARLLIKLSELVLFKPTLKLDDDTKLVWAGSFLKTYRLESVIQAIEQIKHSSCEWVNFGMIAEEARRVDAANSRDYRPFHDPKRLTLSQLREAAADGNEPAAQRLQNDQRRRLLGNAEAALAENLKP
jgi:hypothetical protein